MATMNRQVILAARPEGLPKPSDFRIVETPMPELTEGKFLVRTNYLYSKSFAASRLCFATHVLRCDLWATSFRWR